eukprot:3461032-Pleurochrysis_carterae.AAC.4
MPTPLLASALLRSKQAWGPRASPRRNRSSALVTTKLRPPNYARCCTAARATLTKLEPEFQVSFFCL